MILNLCEYCTNELQKLTKFHDFVSKLFQCPVMLPAHMRRTLIPESDSDTDGSSWSTDSIDGSHNNAVYGINELQEETKLKQVK